TGHQPPKGARAKLGQNHDQPAFRPLCLGGGRTGSRIGRRGRNGDGAQAAGTYGSVEHGHGRGLPPGGCRKMSERWARTMLSAYRIAGAAAYPLAWPYIAWRASKGKEDRKRTRERY